jgi:alanine racemase
MSATVFPESCQANLNIDLEAIAHNYKTLSNQSTSADCAAVIKANAYGLGMIEVANELHYNNGCKIFFVANLREAICLRKSLQDAIIYVFNGLFSDQINCYMEYNIRPILNDISQIKLWNENSAPCAIHFDTGINRLGLSEEETDQYLNKKHDLNISLILSHLTRSEEVNHDDNKKQLTKFQKISRALTNIPASLANSAGIYLGKEFHFDLMRPGIMLYGGNPGLNSLPPSIRPTFEVMGKILQIRHVKRGMSVGYNATWTAKNDTRIAIVNMGYADGYLRSNENGGHAFLCGCKVPIIGKISMDMIALDISGPNFDHTLVGNDVEFIGKNITLEMVSQVSRLGAYQILTTLGERFNRNYISTV